MSDFAKTAVKAVALVGLMYVTGGQAGWWAAAGKWAYTATVLASVAATAIASRDNANRLGSNNDGITQKQVGIQANPTGTEVTLPVIYGKAKVGMSVVDVRQSPSDLNTLALVGAIAVAPEAGSGIEAVTDVYFNEYRSLKNPIFGTNNSSDNPTPFDNSVVKSPWNGNVSSGSFGTDFFLEYFLHNGDEDQTYDYALNAQGVDPEHEFGGAWPTTSVGEGVAYLVLWLYFDVDIYTNGVPGVTLEVKGNKVLDCQDIDDPAAYSENPADCIRDYMTSTRYGMAIPVAQIDCAQTALQANPIATASGSTVVTVSHSSDLDVVVGSRVVLSGAAATGGITAARLNVEMTVASVPSTSSFTADLGGANATSTVSAGGGSSVLFDASSFGLAAAYCDQSVTITLSSGTVTLDERFSCNGFLMPDEGALSNLDRLLSSCCGRIIREGGKYKLLIRKAQSAESFELNRTNIVGDWGFIRTGIEETPNTLLATYVDVDLNYTAQPITWPEPAADNTYLTADNDYATEARLELSFTENRYMAEMIASQQFLESRADFGCSLTAQREALKLSVGDVVNVTHSTPSWTDEPFWVEAVSLRRDGLVQLVLKSYAAATYTVPTMTLKPDIVVAELPARYTGADSPTVQVRNIILEAELQSGDQYWLIMNLDFSGGLGSYKVTHDPAGLPATYSYITDFTGTLDTPYLFNTSAATTPFTFDSGDPPTGRSLISVTPYPDAGGLGIAGPPLSVIFDISDI
jgi:hypothetical protein